MPDEVTDALIQSGTRGRRIIFEVLEHLWQDVMKAASKTVQGQDLEDEISLLWQSLDADLRRDVHDLASMKNYERQNDEQLMQQLRVFMRRIFHPDFEYAIVRTLCIHLNYLQPEAPPDLLCVSPAAPNLVAHEGPRGSLELLHICPENPNIIKYQALFDADPVYDRYRLAFFLNAANQHDGQDWLWGAMEVTAEHMANESPEGSRILLEAKQLIQKRHECYGCLERPPSCTRQAAWTIFKSLILQENYYLSVPELTLIAVLWKFSLSMYQYVPDAPEEEALLSLPSYIDAASDGHAHVVLILGDAATDQRGHFSRMFQGCVIHYFFARFGSGLVENSRLAFLDMRLDICLATLISYADVAAPAYVLTYSLHMSMHVISHQPEYIAITSSSSSS